jgi:pimeloyl-ACP methyl ester carboxylesterase
VRKERRIRVEAGGVRLAVRDWGGPGRVILLLHGLASSSHIFDLVAPRLENAFRVVAYDQRGHGQSAKPSAGYDFEHLARDCLAVIEQLGLDRPVVLGHSWGANVALETAVRSPKAIAGAILLDGGFASMRERMTWAETRERLAPPELAGMPVARFKKMARAMLEAHLAWRPAIEEIVLSYVVVGRDGRIRPRLSRENHMRILRGLWEQDAPALLKRLRVPTLVLACRPADPTPEEEAFLEAKRAAADLVRKIDKRVRFSWIEGIHDVPLQRPAALAARIRDFARSL